MDRSPKSQAEVGRVETPIGIGRRLLLGSIATAVVIGVGA